MAGFNRSAMEKLLTPLPHADLVKFLRVCNVQLLRPATRPAEHLVTSILYAMEKDAAVREWLLDPADEAAAVKHDASPWGGALPFRVQGGYVGFRLASYSTEEKLLYRLYLRLKRESDKFQPQKNCTRDFQAPQSYGAGENDCPDGSVLLEGCCANHARLLAKWDRAQLEKCRNCRSRSDCPDCGELTMEEREYIVQAMIRQVQSDSEDLTDLISKMPVWARRAAAKKQ